MSIKAEKLRPAPRGTEAKKVNWENAVGKRGWLIFVAIQSIGSILAAYGTTYSASAIVHGSWLLGLLLLLPGALPGLAVSQALIHIRPAYIFFPVAVACNAITWVTCCGVWRMFRGNLTRTTQRYTLAFAATALVFGVLNTLHFLRPVTCSDCLFPYGLPFTFYRNGGYTGGGGLVLGGLLADAATIVAIALLLGAFWEYLATKM